MSPIALIPGVAFSDAVSAWLLNAVVYGSLAALLTWMLIKTVFRTARPAVHALLWIVVLLKFIVPWGPGASFSLASLVSGWTGFTAPAVIAPAPPPAGSSTTDVAFVFVERCDVPSQAVMPASPPAPPPASPLGWLVYGYIGFVAVLAAWRLLAYARFARRCAALPKADGSTQVVVSVVCRRLGVRRMPDVRISDAAAAPFVLGVLRPRLVLARRQLAKRSELEAVVLHEVAHLRRGDLFVRHFQWLVGTLLFFWPVVAWVNRRIDLLREYACDEWALRHGRLSAGDYARCLLRAVQPVRSPFLQFRPAAMAATRVNVERRIDMILTAQARTSRRWMWLPIGSAVAVWGAFVLTGADPAIGAAASKKARSDDPLSWFSHAIEEQVSQAQQQREMVVVLNKVVGVDGDAEPQVDVQVMALGCGDAASGVWMRAPQAAPHMFFTRTRDGAGAGGEGVGMFVIGADDDDDTLGRFLADHPTADADANGTLSAAERDAYLAALALSDPAAVIRQYPHADGNQDGTLDEHEAARLVTQGPAGGGMPHRDVLMRHAGAAVADMPRVAGHMLKIVADADIDVQGVAGQPQIIQLRTRIVDGEGNEVECLGANDAIDIPADAGAADGERRVIVQRIVKHGDAPADVRVTINGQAVDPSEIEEVETLPSIRALHAQLMEIPILQQIHGAGATGDVAAFDWSVAAPPTHWLAENLSADVTAADVAKLVPIVEQAPLAAFLEMNPASDADGDGRVTAAERKAFVDQRMSKARAKLLERFPDADADKDGLLTNEELREYFKNRVPRSKPPAEKDGVTGPEFPVLDPC